MSTNLNLKNTTLNGITDTGDGIVYDMTIGTGPASDTWTVNTTAGGTQIQLTKTAGGSTISWISGRVPSGGFTLSGSVIFSILAQESAMSANIGARWRLFRYQPGPTITELGGGPFDDGVEFSTSETQMLLSATPSSQAFNENDRILLRVYITNIGTMGGGQTGTGTFGNTANAGITITENVTFKSETTQVLLSGSGVGAGTASGGLNLTIPLSGSGIGVGTVSGSLSVSRLLDGTAIGVGIAEGGLNLTIPLSGNCDGVATVSGGLNLIIPLSGNIDGLGICDGQLTVQSPPVLLDGNCVGVGIADGSLNIIVVLAGNSNGVGICDGQLNVITGGLVELSGSAVGDGIASGGLNLTIPLSGNIDGIAIVNGGLSLNIFLNGNCIGDGICDGQLSVSGTPAPPSEEYFGGILQLPVNQYLGYKKF